MLKKLITSSLRPLGMFLFYAFAAWCILLSFVALDIKDKSDFYQQLENFTNSFEDRFYDKRISDQLNPHYRSKQIVFLKIDDYSLQKLGVWPIPRTIHAKMIDKLRSFGAKVVALDILYPERSPSYGRVNPDKTLTQAIEKFQQKGRRVFLSYTLTQNPEGALPEAPVEMFNDVVSTHSNGENLQQVYIDKYMFPIDELVASEVGLGFIDSEADSDGIFRKYPLIANVDTIYFGSLGFNAVKAFIGDVDKVNINSSGATVKFHQNLMQLNSKGHTKIRYFMDQHNFPQVSLYDLLEAPDDHQKMAQIFKNKLVFVGSTALGAHDLRPSPLGAQMPGVLTHMNISQMILDGHLFKKSDSSMWFSLGLLSLGALLFYLVQKFGSAFFDALILICLITASYYADKMYFMPHGYEIKLFYCFFCFITCYSWNTLINFYEANKEKKQIRGTFARYVAPTIVDEMLKNPEKLQVGGQRMDITCLFSDVRDFTKISEGLSATELAHSLNLYMGKMTDIVFDTKGTLDKYIGDAIVALWGAPLEIGNHAQHAVEGAIQMIELLPSINEEFKLLGRPVFDVGIGLNSGECSVGNMGSDRIFSYTALGDNMNLGARLESLCKYYGAKILISQFTLDRLDLTNIRIRPIDRVIVKGKTSAVSIYEVLYQFHPMVLSPELGESFRTAHRLFLAKDFQRAKEIFEEILLSLPDDKPTLRFLKICSRYLTDPASVGEDFDVTTMTEK